MKLEPLRELVRMDAAHFASLLEFALRQYGGGSTLLFTPDAIDFKQHKDCKPRLKIGIK